MKDVERFSRWSDDYSSIEEFINQMDSYQWENVPHNVYFLVDWIADEPFSREEECSFSMKATEKASICTVDAKEARKEFERFKGLFVIYSKYKKEIIPYKKKIHELYTKMYEELKNRETV